MIGPPKVNLRKFPERIKDLIQSYFNFEAMLESYRKDFEVMREIRISAAMRTGMVERLLENCIRNQSKSVVDFIEIKVRPSSIV